jgi:hypothetical protein
MNCPSRWSEPAERFRLHEPSSECSSPPSRHPVFNATEGTRRPDCIARLSRVAIFADRSCAVRERPPAQVPPPRVGQPARFAHRERFRRTLEKLLDLLLQRAPIEAGALLQTLDDLLIKARTTIELTRTPPHPFLNTLKSVWSSQTDGGSAPSCRTVPPPGPGCAKATSSSAWGMCPCKASTSSEQRSRSGARATPSGSSISVTGTTARLRPCSGSGRSRSFSRRAREPVGGTAARASPASTRPCES